MRGARPVRVQRALRGPVGLLNEVFRLLRAAGQPECRSVEHIPVLPAIVLNTAPPAVSGRCPSAADSPGPSRLIGNGGATDEGAPCVRCSMGITYVNISSPPLTGIAPSTCPVG
jgi:hypothetical protein